MDSFFVGIKKKTSSFLKMNGSVEPVPFNIKRMWNVTNSFLKEMLLTLYVLYKNVNKICCLVLTSLKSVFKKHKIL